MTAKSAAPAFAVLSTPGASAAFQGEAAETFHREAAETFHGDAPDVPRRGDGPSLELALDGAEPVVASAGVGGKEGPRGLVRRLSQGIGRALRTRPHPGPGMGQARGDPDHDGNLEALGKVEGLPRHLVGFLLVGGLETGDHRELGVESRVLLVLRAVHAGIVGDGQDQPSLDRDESGVDEGIGRDVQAHVFHRDEDAPAGEGSSEGLLVGGLLVGAPGRAGALPRLEKLYQVLEYLRGGSARIAVGRAQSRMDGAQGDRLVPEEYCFIGCHCLASLSRKDNPCAAFREEGKRRAPFWMRRVEWLISPVV